VGGQQLARRPSLSFRSLGSPTGPPRVSCRSQLPKLDVGIDEFSMGDGSRDLLEANLRRYGLSGCTILEGDAFELLRAGALGGRCVSVYYYDAAHDYESQCAALRLVESSLAESALLIVDDMDWTQVARATRDYRARQPRARLLIELAGKDRDQPWWWEGVQILRWQ
jgi:hypothetical protein